MMNDVIKIRVKQQETCTNTNTQLNLKFDIYYFN